MQDTNMMMESWPCHIHTRSSSAPCEMTLATEIVNNVETIQMYHVIQISKTSKTAQKFNVRNDSQRFWEKLPVGRKWITTVYNSTEKQHYIVFQQILSIFKILDNNNVIYEKYDKPLDFLRYHLLTDGECNIELCNKHLMRTRVVSKRKTPTLRYTAPSYIYKLLNEMFPKSTSNLIANVTPQWALDKLFEIEVFLKNNRSVRSKPSSQQVSPLSLSTTLTTQDTT